MSRVALVLLFPLALIAACGDDNAETTDAQVEDAPVDDAPVVIDGTWLLVSGTIDGAPVSLVDGGDVTMNIDGGQIAGTAACNGYGGTLDIGDGTFSVRGLWSNDTWCESVAAMDLEEAYLRALSDIVSSELTDGALALSGPGVDLVLEPTDPPPEPPPPPPIFDRKGGVDGPVIFAADTDRAGAGTAEIGGELVLEGDCLYVSSDRGRFPVLWPWGTFWQPDSATIRLWNGEVTLIGGRMVAGGAYVDPDDLDQLTSPAAAALGTQCADGESGEVAHVQTIRQLTIVP